MVLLAVPPLPSRCASWRAVRVASVYLMSAHAAPRAAATLLVIAKATSRVRTSARECGRPCCCCGCGLRRSPDSGISREVARGPRDARAAMNMRARLEAAPRVARNWGLVRPLLPAWRLARRARCRLPRVLGAAHRGHRGRVAVRIIKWPPKPPYDLPRHRRDTASGPSPSHPHPPPEGPTERQKRRKRHFFGPKIAAQEVAQALGFTWKIQNNHGALSQDQGCCLAQNGRSQEHGGSSKEHSGNRHEHYGSFPGTLRHPPRTLWSFPRNITAATTNITVVTAKTTVVAHERGKSPSHVVSVARARDIELDLHHLCCRCYTRPVRLSLCVRAC